VPSAEVRVLRTAPVATLVATTSVFAAGAASVVTCPRRFEPADWADATGVPSIRQLATAEASNVRSGVLSYHWVFFVCNARLEAPAALDMLFSNMIRSPSCCEPLPPFGSRL
jgi:hypothetical protein